MIFRIVSKISSIETIAVGKGIREIGKVCDAFGPARWRKMKGRAWVELPNGRKCLAEIHWYEAHGIGRKKFKIKREL